MNLFITSQCPEQCAAFLDDKRVVKMCLETAQILSTALRERGYVGDNVYKTTHKNHPVCVWARETRGNFGWTILHLKALCREYKLRYGKTHKCESMIPTFFMLARLIPNGKQTKFVNCAANSELGISYKHENNIYKAYQLYLNDRWNNDKREPTWGGRA